MLDRMNNDKKIFCLSGRYHSPVQSIDTDDDGSPVHAGTSHWSGSHSNVVGLHYTEPKKKDKGKGKCVFAAEMLGSWRAWMLASNVAGIFLIWFDVRDEKFVFTLFMS